MTIQWGTALAKTELDAGTDHPKPARAQLEAIIDRINTKLASVTLIQSTDLSNNGADGTVAETSGGGFPNVSTNVTRSSAQLNSGWFHVGTVDLSSHGSTDVDLTQGFGAGYKALKFVFRNLAVDRIAGAIDGARIQLSNDGGTSFRAGASDYASAQHEVDESGGSATGLDETDAARLVTFLPSDQDSPIGYLLDVTVWDADEASRLTVIEWTGTSYAGDSSKIGRTVGTAFVLTAEVNNAMRFFTSGNNITQGVVDIWGLSA